jgi:hypothetical protein
VTNVTNHSAVSLLPWVSAGSLESVLVNPAIWPPSLLSARNHHSTAARTRHRPPPQDFKCGEKELLATVVFEFTPSLTILLFSRTFHPAKDFEWKESR